MPRHALPPAMKDTLLAAVVAKLPPSGTQWPLAEREAWFTMMRNAVDVAYGPCERPVISIPTVFLPPGTEQATQWSTGPFPPITVSTLPSSQIASASSGPEPPRFHIDREGFAMCDGRPIDPREIPSGSILWDERTGRDHGDIDAIMWKSTGASREPLPAGVHLRAGQAHQANGEATT